MRQTIVPAPALRTLACCLTLVPAYAILRMKGISIGKMNYLGQLSLTRT